MASRRQARSKAADLQAAQNRYDAAGSGRRVARWQPPAAGPRRAVEGASRMLQRTRDAVRNDWAAESSIGKWTSNLIGTGIQPRWKAKDIRPVWDRWGKQADADGVLDIYGLEALLTRAWLEAGEVFLRRRPRRIDAPLEVPLQVQLIESEYVPIFDTLTWPGLPEGNRICQGIELNKYGRRTAIWVYKEHPGDGNMAPGRDQLVRVAISEIAHVFEPKRAGQLRGVTPLSSVLLRLRSSGDFEDAVLERQKLANLFTMFITRTLPPEWADIDFDPDTGLPKFYDTAGTPLVGLEPGISQELRPGENVTFANPPEAGTTYPEYLRSNTLGTAAGQHMPYEFLTGDIKDVSDRSLRVVVQEFRRFAQQRQWLFLIPQACQRIVDWFAEAAVLAGTFSTGRLEEIKAPEWSPQAWEYLHPVQDAQGKQILLEMGVVTVPGLIAERGDDPEKVTQQRADFKKLEDSLGLTPPPPPAPGAGTGQPKQGANGKPQASMEDIVMALVARPQGSAQPTAADAALASMGALVAAQQQAQAELVATLQRNQAASVEMVARIAQALAERGINVAAPEVNATINVEPTPVAINVEPTPVVMQQGDTIVNVEPTPIDVHNTVNAQPGAVSVSVELPDRQIDTEFIDRNDKGQLTRVRQVEKTLN